MPNVDKAQAAKARKKVDAADEFRKELRRGITRTEELLRSQAHHHRPFVTLGQDAGLSIEMIRAMFEASWQPIHALLDSLLEGPLRAMKERALDVLQHAIAAALFLGARGECEKFATLLAKLQNEQQESGARAAPKAAANAPPPPPPGPLPSKPKPRSSSSPAALDAAAAAPPSPPPPPSDDGAGGGSGRSDSAGELPDDFLRIGRAAASPGKSPGKRGGLARAASCRLEVEQQYLDRRGYRAEEWYVLLMEATPEDALDVMGTLYMQIVKVKTTLEADHRREALASVARRIERGTPLLLGDGHHARSFLREGDLLKRCRNGKVVTYRFFLFTDQLLYTHRLMTGEYRVHEQLLLSIMQIGALDRDRDKSMREFYIHHPKKSFVVVAETKEEKQNWMRDITMAQVAELERKSHRRGVLGSG